MKIKKNVPPSIKGCYSAEFKQFAALCLKKNPDERPTVSELLNNPFM